jgi:hypothetical protein
MISKFVSTLVLLLISGLSSAVVFAQHGMEEPIYHFDPALNLKISRPPAIAADPQVVIEKRDRQTSVRLQTETPLSPYFGAERGPQLSAEELRLLPEGKEQTGLSAYQLEAGVGVFVEDKASLNLGYRFHDPPSLLDERRTDPLSLSGDLRIGFDLKVPF